MSNFGGPPIFHFLTSWILIPKGFRPGHQISITSKDSWSCRFRFCSDQLLHKNSHWMKRFSATQKDSEQTSKLIPSSFTMPRVLKWYQESHWKNFTTPLNSAVKKIMTLSAWELKAAKDYYADHSSHIMRPLQSKLLKIRRKHAESILNNSHIVCGTTHSLMRARRQNGVKWKWRETRIQQRLKML